MTVPAAPKSSTAHERVALTLLAAVPLAAAGGMVVIGDAFAYGVPREDLPILTFTVGAITCGLVFFVLSWRVFEPAVPWAETPAKLLAIALVGFAARLLLLVSEPILEVDFNRYLWDGGLVAHGFNPYALAPADVTLLAYNDPRLALSKSSAPAFEMISYPAIKTIYPPVAQAAFALAHLLAPWSLTAWRIVCIVADVGTFLLLVALLRACGRSPYLVLLYWWNPLVLKELVNSAHMEAVLLPSLLASLLFAVRARPIVATVFLGLAIGTKLWPILLVPLIWRPLIGNPRRLAQAIAALAGMVALFAWPVWLAGAGSSSGFIVFAEQWATNSALFQVLQGAAGWLLGLSPTVSLLPSRLARLLCAVVVSLVALHQSRAPVVDARDFMRRATLVVSVLLLLSPVQFPWYLLWVLPLAVIQPSLPWHLAAGLMPLYYVAFHLQRQNLDATYGAWLPWFIWIPVWIAFFAFYRLRGRPVS